MKAEVFNDYFLTFDELVEKMEVEHVYHTDKELVNQSIFQQAKNDPRCKFTLANNGCMRPYVVITDPIFEDMNTKIGFLVCVYPGTLNQISIYEAIAPNEYRNYIHDGFNLGDYPLDINLNELINKVKDSYGVCPICGKRVGPMNLHRVGFAGCCCEECLPAAQKEYEYPGWYN